MLQKNMFALTKIMCADVFGVEVLDAHTGQDV